MGAELPAPGDGWLEVTDCRAVGLALADLGGARVRVEDAIDPAVGIEWLVRTGQRVTGGETVARLRAPDGPRRDAALARLGRAFAVRDHEVSVPALVQAG